MTNHFVDQGYPTDTITKGRTKASNKEREDTLRKTIGQDPEEKEEPLVMVTTFQPEFKTMKEIIQKNWDLLNKSTATKELAERKMLFGY